MNAFFWYLFEVSLSLSAFYLLYAAVLRNHTFFNLNRFYLLSGLLLSFVIPVLKIPFFQVQSPTIVTDMMRLHPIEPDYVLFTNQNLAHGLTTINYTVILQAIYLAGIIILFIKLFFSIIRIVRMKNQSDIHKLDKVKIVRTDTSVPFSFFHMIFLPKDEQNPMIIEHELAHIRQLHWLDLVLTELATVLLWFNPIVFLYRSSLKLQHEYLADSSVLTESHKTEGYLRSMLRQVEMISTGGLVSHFYQKTIKKRIIMMTKNKTSRKYLGLYLLVIPMISLLLFAFAPAGSNGSLSIGKNTVVNSEASRPSIYPVARENITHINGWGERKNPYTKKKQFHHAIDFAAKEGTNIVAPAAGVVVEAQMYDKGMGNIILIKHNDVYSTYYAHLKSISVKPGDVLKKGQIIGQIGSTGISTGPHLHYEVYKNGERVNPEDYLPK